MWTEAGCVTELRAQQCQLACLLCSVYSVCASPKPTQHLGFAYLARPAAFLSPFSAEPFLQPFLSLRMLEIFEQWLVVSITGTIFQFCSPLHWGVGHRGWGWFLYYADQAFQHLESRKFVCGKIWLELVILPKKEHTIKILCNSFTATKMGKQLFT